MTCLEQLEIFTEQGDLCICIEETKEVTVSTCSNIQTGIHFETTAKTATRVIVTAASAGSLCGRGSCCTGRTPGFRSLDCSDNAGLW